MHYPPLNYPMLSNLHYNILPRQYYFTTTLSLLPNYLHCTIRDLYYKSATNNVSIFLPIVLFAIFSDLLCTDVISTAPTIIPSYISDNIHIYFFISSPLCPPVSILYHKTFTPISICHHYQNISDSCIHIPCPPPPSIVPNPPITSAIQFISDRKWNGGPIEKIEQSIKVIGKYPSRTFTISYLHFSNICLKVKNQKIWLHKHRGLRYWLHTTLYTRVIVNSTKWIKKNPFCGARSSINILI